MSVAPAATVAEAETAQLGAAHSATSLADSLNLESANSAADVASRVATREATMLLLESATARGVATVDAAAAIADAIGTLFREASEVSALALASAAVAIDAAVDAAVVGAAHGTLSGHMLERLARAIGAAIAVGSARGPLPLPLTESGGTGGTSARRALSGGGGVEAGSGGSETGGGFEAGSGAMDDAPSLVPLPAIGVANLSTLSEPLANALRGQKSAEGLRAAAGVRLYNASVRLALVTMRPQRAALPMDGARTERELAVHPWMGVHAVWRTPCDPLLRPAALRLGIQRPASSVDAYGRDGRRPPWQTRLAEDWGEATSWGSVAIDLTDVCDYQEPATATATDAAPTRRTLFGREEGVVAPASRHARRGLRFAYADLNLALISLANDPYAAGPPHETPPPSTRVVSLAIEHVLPNRSVSGEDATSELLPSVTPRLRQTPITLPLLPPSHVRLTDHLVEGANQTLDGRFTNVTWVCVMPPPLPDAPPAMPPPPLPPYAPPSPPWLPPPSPPPLPPMPPPSPPPPSPPPPMAPPPPPPPPFGCTESVALNYRSFAIVDDGSCILGGCTDGLASNFDPRATYNGARTPNPASRALADASHAWGTSATTTSHTHAPSRTICCRSQLPSHAHI